MELGQSKTELSEKRNCKGNNFGYLKAKVTLADTTDQCGLLHLVNLSNNLLGRLI